MGRLKTLPPRLATLPGRLKLTESAGRSGLRHLYHTARWQKLRDAGLLASNYTCAMCGRVQGKRMVWDHVHGHGAWETEAQFWAGPFQALCTTCHEGDKKRQDNAASRGT